MRLSVVGSTGSIGTQTLEVARGLRVQVAALAAGRNADKLFEQAVAFRPEVLSLEREQDAEALRARIYNDKTLAAEGYRPDVGFGAEGVSRAINHPMAGTVVLAAAGGAGVPPAIVAARSGKRVAIANKESLVTVGKELLFLARVHRTQFIPVDSEHSAIFHCLAGREREDVRRIVLTASGGPFFGKSAADLEAVTPETALRHPVWSMGAKVTVDSATLANKGLEVLEAAVLFSPPSGTIEIDVVVHPPSVVHSLVEFQDGTMLAQLAPPDMRTPIQAALTWPRAAAGLGGRLDLTALGDALRFYAPDLDAFPCLALAFEALKGEGADFKRLPAAYCVADEVAVERFLRREIGFADIPRLIRDVMGDAAVWRRPAGDKSYGCNPDYAGIARAMGVERAVADAENSIESIRGVMARAAEAARAWRPKTRAAGKR